jgi:aspartate ammonia-lyase
MFPVLADSLITILKLSASGVSVFALNCIQQLSANPQKCQEFLEKSTVYATLLVPKLGYDTVTEIVKEAIQTKRSIRELVIQKKLLTQAEFETLINRQIQ